MTVELIPLEGLPEVEPGDDLAALLAPPLAAHGATDGDVVAITQKVVSKAEGRMVPAADRGHWVERESVDLVARRGDLVITRTRHGLVCANAGVDASNVREGLLTLLPEDPDASAGRLRNELTRRLVVTRLGVVITDTFGRPWREGLVDVAIGCAGLPPLLDLRGTTDDHGAVLETTVVALADAVAAASGLVMTKTARVPAALVRGLTTGDAPPGPARALVRPAADDLFRESAFVAVASARSSDRFGAGGVPRTVVEEAIGAAGGASPGDRSFVAVDSPAARQRLLTALDPDRADAVRSASVLIVPCVRAPAGSPEEAILLDGGAAIRTLVVALHAQGLAWSWDAGRPFDPRGVRDALGLGAEWRPLGVVAVGPRPRVAAASAGRPRASPDLPRPGRP